MAAPDNATTRTLVEGFLDGCEQGSADALRAVTSDDCVAWHNTDDLVLTAEVGIARICNWRASIAAFRFERLALLPTTSGAVLQSNMHITLKDGRALTVPGCTVFTIHHGRIVRWDDYFDSAPMRALRP